MARGINKAIIVGTLGRDPEVKYTAGGQCVCTMSVATNESWKDKNTGENVEKTEWHRITLFGKLGEIAQQYLKKGAQVYLEGKIQTDKWQDNNGIERYTTKIIANVMQMLGGGNNSENTGNSQSYNSQPQQSSFDSPPQDDFDDIPF